MFSGIKAQWAELKQFAPGERFTAFHGRQRERNRGKPWKQVLITAAAIGSFLVGVVLAFIPGPAVVFFGLSLALLAGQSRRIAAFLDATEVRVRGWLRSAHAYWLRLRYYRPEPRSSRPAM